MYQLHTLVLRVIRLLQASCKPGGCGGGLVNSHIGYDVHVGLLQKEIPYQPSSIFRRPKERNGHSPK